MTVTPQTVPVIVTNAWPATNHGAPVTNYTITTNLVKVDMIYPGPALQVLPQAGGAIGGPIGEVVGGGILALLTVLSAGYNRYQLAKHIGKFHK